MYLGMNAKTGGALTDIEHIRQSVRDILITPVGSRIMRRDYGSLFFRLLDQPQNDATILKMFSATYTALSQWEPRIKINAIDIHTTMNGEMIIELDAVRVDTSDNIALSVGVMNVHTD